MCAEILWGKIIDANENSELYKGLLSFMIEGLKENVPCIIKSVPEPSIGWPWMNKKTNFKLFENFEKLWVSGLKQ